MTEHQILASSTFEIKCRQKNTNCDLFNKFGFDFPNFDGLKSSPFLTGHSPKINVKKGKSLSFFSPTSKIGAETPTFGSQIPSCISLSLTKPSPSLPSLTQIK